MKKVRMMFVGVASALLGVACAADDYSCRGDHAVSDGDHAKNANKMDFHEGLRMSANPHCCGNHWGAATADFNHGIFTSANPYYCGHHKRAIAVDDTIAPTDEVGDDGASIDAGPAGKADGASFPSGVDTDASEAEDDGSKHSSEPAEITVGASSRSAAGAKEEDTNAVSLESSLRLQKRGRKDTNMRVVLTPGSHTEPASLEMSATSTRSVFGDTRAQTIQLIANTRVQAVSVTRFHVSSSEGSWTFIADDRAQRDVWINALRAQRDAWINALVYAIAGTDHTGMFSKAEMVSGEDSAAPAGNPTDILEIKTSVRGMQPRRVTLLGSTLTACKVAKDGRATKSCQELTLDRHSDAVRVTERQERKRTHRALFRVTTDSYFTSAKSWTFDAGTSDEQAKWIALIKGAVREVKDDEGIDAENEVKDDGDIDAEHEVKDDGDIDAEHEVKDDGVIDAEIEIKDDGGVDVEHEVKDDGGIDAEHEVKDDRGIDAEKVEEFSSSKAFDPRYRGWTLGPTDQPLLPGMFLARLYKSPFTLEVTEIGDILISPGYLPDRTQEPLWAHRATGSFNGLANGGLVCALEAFWQRMMSEEQTQTALSVKNGRWRVGRGRFCTLGQSPAPPGSLRRFLPWDARGSAIRGAALQLLEDGTAMIGSGKYVFWDSYWG